MITGIRNVYSNSRQKYCTRLFLDSAVENLEQFMFLLYVTHPQMPSFVNLLLCLTLGNLNFFPHTLYLCVLYDSHNVQHIVYFL